ncbi:hypothetical protein GCM10022254_63580 [Actinomadura meridiana]|uniref:HTH merR-type domain-containing protein n=1 Tax=Actinomadura meridiana TaxID=559626 RepID=A0ABP8CK32_9ACTN
MRIGELAALVRVSTRAVRHYHHVGLLPEPERLAGLLDEAELSADSAVSPEMAEALRGLPPGRR